MNLSLGAHCETPVGERGSQQTMALAFFFHEQCLGLGIVAVAEGMAMSNPQTILSAGACWGRLAHLGVWNVLTTSSSALRKGGFSTQGRGLASSPAKEPYMLPLLPSMGRSSLLLSLLFPGNVIR